MFGDRGFSKPDDSIPGLYRETFYTRKGGKNFKILGRPFPAGGAWGASTTEYEIKPNGRYTRHWYCKRITNQRPRVEGPDSTITLHPNGGYTINQNGTYTISGHDITFTYRYCRLSELNINLKKLGATPIPRNYFVKNGFVCIRNSARFLKGGFVFGPQSPEGKPSRMSDEEFQQVFNRFGDSIKGYYWTGFNKV